MARLATSGLSVVWVPLKATRTILRPGSSSRSGVPAGNTSRLAASECGFEKISRTLPCSTTVPLSKMATWLHTSSTTLIWWVMITTVMPISRLIFWISLGSMLLALPEGEGAAKALDYIKNYPGITYEEVGSNG